MHAREDERESMREMESDEERERVSRSQSLGEPKKEEWITRAEKERAKAMERERRVENWRANGRGIARGKEKSRGEAGAKEKE